jgi:hypothetical protein
MAFALRACNARGTDQVLATTRNGQQKLVYRSRRPKLTLRHIGSRFSHQIEVAPTEEILDGWRAR